jgi:hypothetical protein
MAFTYSGPSTAATFTVGVFNEQLAVANHRLEKSDNYTRDALAGLGNTPSVSEVRLSGSALLSPPPSLDGMSPGELSSLYRGTSAEITAMLADGLTYFLTTYFPLGAELALAQAWVVKALSTGGTGLDPAIEDQIWQRDRSRILKDAARSTAQAMSLWAARGYPLPPGGLVGQVALIDQDARDKIAQSSRDIAIKQAEMELENIRFAVDKAISMRTTAIQAAGDYIRTLALGPQLGAELATSMADAKMKMAQALTSLYQAEVAAVELPVRASIAEANANVEIRKANLGAQVETIRARVSVVEAAAQSAGTQAAAALNALNASTGFSGSEQV